MHAVYLLDHCAKCDITCAVIYTLPEIILHNPLSLERIELIWEKTLLRALTDIFGTHSYCI